MKPRTLYEKLWDSHALAHLGGDEWLLYIDRHLVYEVTSPQAFESLRAAGRRVRRPDLTLAVADHNVPTLRRAPGLAGIRDRDSRLQVRRLERNAEEFGVPYAALGGPSHGIVHVIGPELGLTLPGCTVACGDSHTSTHGALGALALGIGTSEVEHVLATQTLVQKRSRTMLVRLDGLPGLGITPKDLVLALIRQIGAGGARDHVIEYAGEAVRAMGMAGRMTLCNMAVEAGARTGMIAPDESCIAWLEGRPGAPAGAGFHEAARHWRTLASDPGAAYDRAVDLDAAAVVPMVSWGTSPDAVTSVAGSVPDPDDAPDPAARAQLRRMIDYMGLTPGQRLAGLGIDAVFIGSCTNSRIEDLREAAAVARGRSVAPGIRALVVPGSAAVKRQAEAEGLDRIFTSAGFQWRDAGCSMCLGMNEDRLRSGERCASTSNRNFEGRQGTGGRTHLMSPPMAAAAAIFGHIVDVRELRR